MRTPVSAVTVAPRNAANTKNARVAEYFKTDTACWDDDRCKSCQSSLTHRIGSALEAHAGLRRQMRPNLLHHPVIVCYPTVAEGGRIPSAVAKSIKALEGQQRCWSHTEAIEKVSPRFRAITRARQN